MWKLVCSAVAVACLVTPTLAGADDPPPDPGHHHGPSPEALAACKDKKDGDACEFDAPTVPSRHVAGTCHVDHSGELACRHPHHHADGGSGK